MSDIPIAPETLAKHCVSPGSILFGIAATGRDAVNAVAYLDINTAIAAAQRVNE
ncbi:hypothetical protein D3C76_1767990 [compost metagenome]